MICAFSRRWLRGLIACSFVLAAAQGAGASAARSVDGVVVWVSDGDSLRLKPAAGGALLELRLQEIDAPEICQPWGTEARDALRERVLNKPVRAQLSGVDVYGRTLATLYLGEVNVNQTLVKEGHAWSTRYQHDRGRYVSEERMAAALGRGFNRAGGAVMPREFRRDHGPCQPDEAVVAPAVERAASQAPVAPVLSSSYRCDGRTRCNQMHSCAEATYFLRNCPGVQMDGNHDGVPCERQWCGPAR